MPAAEREKKKSVLPTLFFAMLLLAVIGWGASKIKPALLAAKAIGKTDAQQGATEPAKPSAPNAATTTGANSVTAVPSQAGGTQDATSAPIGLPTSVPTNAPGQDVEPRPAGPSISSTSGSSIPASGPVTTAATPATPTAANASGKAETKTAAPAKPEVALSAKAAQYKTRVEAIVADRGLASRVKVQGFGTSLTLVGKLHPAEHGALLKFLRDSPPEVRLIDHIEYDDTPTAAAEPDESSHPVATPNRGAIHVVTDVLGATAKLFGTGGRQIKQCQTPCSFTGLEDTSFSLEVTKNGYKTIQTALQVRAGEVVDQKLKLESLSVGLLVVSDPAGANVFINGAKQGGQTPLVLPLPAGQYDLVLRMPGYAAYSGHVQVKDNVQTELSVQMHAKDNSKMAWADVASKPSGAEIVVDGTTTSQFTPARVQLTPGLHTITLKMRGFQVIRRTVQVSEGGTVGVEETLKPFVR